MKKLLQIMSVITLTTITTVNLTACEFLNNSSSVDWDQKLNDAANLISTTNDDKFKDFLYDKTKTKVNDFKDDIIVRIGTLFRSSKQDYSLLLYSITNLDDIITNTTTIKLELSVDYAPNFKKTCSFTANFTDIQTFVNKKLAPYTNTVSQPTKKGYFKLNKGTNSFYQILIDYGAKFEQTSNKTNTFKTSDLGPGPKNKKASEFWGAFYNAKGNEETKTSYLGNVLYPIFQLFGLKDMGGLTFFNFEVVLQTYDNTSNVIAMTGHKKFDGESYDYIEINIKGVQNGNVDLSGNFNGLTFIFQ